MSRTISELKGTRIALNATKISVIGSKYCPFGRDWSPMREAFIPKVFKQIDAVADAPPGIEARTWNGWYSLAA